MMGIFFWYHLSTFFFGPFKKFSFQIGKHSHVVKVVQFLCIRHLIFPSGQSVSSVAQSCLTLCDPMNCSTPGLPVHHQLPEFTQTHVH